jgi:hypothetical protein
LKREELRSLIEKRKGHCVSIYLPTSQPGLEPGEVQIRLKNLLRDAEERLLALGLESNAVGRLLEPARQFLEAQAFRPSQSEGMALFLAENFFRHDDVPFSFPEALVVTDGFYLKPLLGISPRTAGIIYCYSARTGSGCMKESAPVSVKSSRRECQRI